MTDIVERARLVQRVNAHWLDSICDCDECTEERFDLITPMADEIEALRARVAQYEADPERCPRCETLLREARDGVKNSAVQFGYPYTDLVDRIDAFLAPPLDMVPAPDGSRVLVVNEGLRELQRESEDLGMYDSASAKLAAAGYTKRDTRLQCDECGKWFTPQLLPAHKCAADQPPEVVK